MAYITDCGEKIQTLPLFLKNSSFICNFFFSKLKTFLQSRTLRFKFFRYLVLIFLNCLCGLDFTRNKDIPCTSKFRGNNWSKNADGVKNWPTFKARPINKIYKRTERSDNKDYRLPLRRFVQDQTKQNKLMVWRRKLEENTV